MTDGKVVIVTGASQGIGAGLLEAYLNAGYSAIANARSLSPNSNPNVINVPGDIADPETADRIMREGVQKFGRVDTLINNAGIFISKPFTQYAVSDFEAIVSTNLAGFFHITQRVVPLMERAGRGHVVTITTTQAEQPIKGAPAVLASLTKGGLNAAMKSLAIEYASIGIRVNAVSLGIIKTPVYPDESYAGLASMHPLERLGEVRDVVSAVMYLENAPFVTGEISHVDGGQSAGHW